jgi:magnesium-transporting ATPase (P-type)
MIGKIATLATDTHTERSSLQVEVHRLVWFVGILAFVVAMTLFVIGLARREISPLNAFVNGFILVVVANVPEVSVIIWLYASFGANQPGLSSCLAEGEAGKQKASVGAKQVQCVA